MTNLGGASYGPIIGPYLFLGKFVWTNGPESSSKVSPYTGIGPWMAIPSLGDWAQGTDPDLQFRESIRALLGSCTGLPPRFSRKSKPGFF